MRNRVVRDRVMRGPPVLILSGQEGKNHYVQSSLYFGDFLDRAKLRSPICEGRQNRGITVYSPVKKDIHATKEL